MTVEKYDNWDKIFCEITTSNNGVSRPISALLKYQKKLDGFTDKMKEQFAMWAFARFDICMGGYNKNFLKDSPINDIEDKEVKRRFSSDFFLSYELSEGFLTLDKLSSVYNDIDKKRLTEARKALALIETLKDTQYIQNLDIVQEMYKQKTYPISEDVLEIFESLAKLFNKESCVFDNVIGNITHSICQNIMDNKKKGKPNDYLKSLLKCQAYIIEEAVSDYVIKKLLEMNDVLTLELLNEVIKVHEKTGKNISDVIFLKNHIEKMDVERLLIKENDNSLTFDLTNIAVLLKTTPNQIMKNINLLTFNYSGTYEEQQRGELNAFEMYSSGGFDFRKNDMGWIVNYKFKESEKLKKEDIANIFKKAMDDWIKECSEKGCLKTPEGNGGILTYDYLMRKDVANNMGASSVKKALKF